MENDIVILLINVNINRVIENECKKWILVYNKKYIWFLTPLSLSNIEEYINISFLYVELYVESFFSWFYLLGHCRTLQCIDENPNICSSWRLGWIHCLWKKTKKKKACVVYVNMDWWRILFLFRAVSPHFCCVSSLTRTFFLLCSASCSAHSSYL